MLRPLTEVGEELSHWAQSDIPRIPTGYSIYDSRTGGGVAPGEVFLFLARTGVGKTWFAINVANNNPTVPTLFFSLEMHGRYILQRLAGVHMDVSTTMVETALRTKGTAHAVKQTVEDFPKLYIEDTPGRTIGNMLEACDEFEVEVGERPLLVLIDYVELLRGFGMSQMETVDSLTWGLKDFAREADVAVVALHQVKRGETNKTRGRSRGFQNQGHLPLSMTDARFGGEMAADYLGAMYRPALDPDRPDYEREMLANDLRLQFLKTRSAGGLHPGGMQHHWDERTGRISEIEW